VPIVVLLASQAVIAQGAPGIVLDPTSADAGSKVRVQGTDFPRQRPGGIFLDGVVDIGPKFHADEAGGFLSDVTIPSDASTGPHVIVAEAMSGEQLAIAPFVVLEATPTPTPTPADVAAAAHRPHCPCRHRTGRTGR